MEIACYTIAYNEELILPHFIDHYKQFCDKIVIYNNMSTDKTKEIALDNGCEVVDWRNPSDGTKSFNDLVNVQIKSTCYLKDRGIYDWVITVDADEFYTHLSGIDEFISTLERYKAMGVKLPKVQGYNMFSWDYDFNSPLSSIDLGIPSENYSKLCLFNPILDMQWGPGCHHCGLQSDSVDTSIILKHYKTINFDYVVNRYKVLQSVQSDTNKKYNYSTHVYRTKEEWREEFVSLENLALKLKP